MSKHTSKRKQLLLRLCLLHSGGALSFGYLRLGNLDGGHIGGIGVHGV